MSILNKNIFEIGPKTGLVIFVIFILVVGFNIFSSNSSDNKSSSDSASVTSLNDSEYGNSYDECMQKADEWFKDSEQTAQKVIEDEIKAGFYSEYDVRKETDYIMSTLRLEKSAFQNECIDRFK